MKFIFSVSSTNTVLFFCPRRLAYKSLITYFLFNDFLNEGKTYVVHLKTYYICNVYYINKPEMQWRGVAKRKTIAN